MHKLLIKKEEKRFVPELKRETVLSKEWHYYVRDATKDVQTPFGMIAKKELGKKSGSIIKTKQGKTLCLMDSGFVDDWKHIKKTTQIITQKETGQIIATTGLNKDSIIVEAGTGSGALACFLAHQCKHVTSYDTDEKNLATAKQNAELLGLKNITFKKGDICKKIPEKNVDVFILDVPNPEKATRTAAKALKTGGWLVAYTLQATQLQAIANAVQQDKHFLHVKSSELIERLWKIEGKTLRPQNIPIGHTGFLTFARKIC